MTTQKTLEKILEIQKADAARNFLIEELIKELNADLLKEEAKKNGTGNKKKAADNILKQLKNSSKQGGAITTADGSQIIGGAFSAVKLMEPLPVEPAPGNIPPIDYIYCLDNAAKNNGVKMELPALAELSAHIKAEKANKNKYIYYDFGDGLPLVDAQYLYDILVLLPDSVCIASKEALTRALYFKSEAGEGLLLPCRKKV